LWSIPLLLVCACDAEADASATEYLDRPGEKPEAVTTPLLAYPEAGHIDLGRSAITPWCSAVLLRSNVAVTTQTCTNGASADELTATFGTETIDVEAIELPAADAHGLVALRLARAVAAIDPAAVNEAVPPDAVADSIGRRYVTAQEVSPRWVWSGSLSFTGDPSRLRLTPSDGKPSCHGEAGAGVFVDGDLVGLTVAGLDRNEDGCVQALEVASLAAADEFVARLSEL
jgi:hypothetical protein